VRPSYNDNDDDGFRYATLWRAISFKTVKVLKEKSIKSFSVYNYAVILVHLKLTLQNQSTIIVLIRFAKIPFQTYDGYLVFISIKIKEPFNCSIFHPLKSYFL
jgi:hypothetical protein